MAVTKNDVSMTAAAVASGTVEGSPVSSAENDVGLGVSGVMKLVNGGSAPTTECQIGVKVKPFGVNVWEWLVGPFRGGKDINGIYSWAFIVRPEWEKFRIDAFGNVGATVTASCTAGRLTSL